MQFVIMELPDMGVTMEVDFSNTLNDIKKASQKLDDIADIYRSVDWEDEVYKSYDLYIRECNEEKENLMTHSNELTSIEQAVKNIKRSDQMSSELESIASQSASIMI